MNNGHTASPDFRSFINMSGKILALDVGKKILGCAVVGEDGISPEPLPPIIRHNESLSLGPLRRLCVVYRIHTLVVGLPLKNGTSNRQSRKTKGFISKIKKHFPQLKVIIQDETLSTWSARKNFYRLKLKKGTSPINIDSFAAREILISYLNNKTSRKITMTQVYDNPND